MKSPWLHPNSPNEFLGATLMIIVGCVLFAYFLGNVTAVITAANAAGGRYRGQIENLQNFCKSQGVSAKMTEKLLGYQDALWTETSAGMDINAMINSLPYHLLPYVLIGHIYRPLMNACPFLYDCSAWGCVEILSALKVQVCEKGDTILHEGTLIGAMYILVRGEVKIDAYEEPEKEVPDQRPILTSHIDPPAPPPLHACHAACVRLCTSLLTVVGAAPVCNYGTGRWRSST